MLEAVDKDTLSHGYASARVKGVDDDGVDKSTVESILEAHTTNNNNRCIEVNYQESRLASHVK